MPFMSLAAAAVLLLAPLPATPLDTVWTVQAQPPSPPAASAPRNMTRAQMEDYVTTRDNCTYRRTKAPGYPEMWVLVLNPHHVGRPNSPARCKGLR